MEGLLNSRIFKTIIDVSPLFISLFDIEGRFIFTNKAFCNYIDVISPEYVIGKTANELGIEVDASQSAYIKNQIETNGYLDNYELSIIHNNNKADVYISIRSIKINHQKFLLLSGLDISNKKKNVLQSEEQLKRHLENLVRDRTLELDIAMEELKATNEEVKSTNEELYRQREELEITLKMLKEAQEQLVQTEKMASLGILTAGVAHEINNPVNYIYNGSLAIENYIHENNPETYQVLKPFFEAINTGIIRTTNIVNSLNRFSRNDSFNRVKCNIHQIIEDALIMLYNQYKTRIDIIKNFYSEIPDIFASEVKLHQVFLNIILNAIQSINDKGKITIRTSVDNNLIIISIKDTGIGISKENKKHIFDPFFTTKDPGKGTGLGLSISQSIIHEHNGTIICKSELNVGSEFIINFPIN